MKKKMIVLMSLTVSFSLNMAAVSMAADPNLERFLNGGTGIEDEESNDMESEEPAPEILTSGDYSYYVNDDQATVTIAGYTGSETVIEIPSELEGYPVSYIGYQAFTYMEMNSLIIPDGILGIEARAFEYCAIPDSIRLPAGITIGEDAFSYALLPSDVKIPDSSTIEKNAFSYSEEMKHVFIGPGTVVKGRAFEYCDDLNLVVCANGCSLESGAFGYCGALEKVVLCGEAAIADDAFPEGGSFYLTEAAEGEYETWTQSGQDTTQQQPPAKTTPGTTPEPASGMIDGGWETTRTDFISKSDLDVFNRARPDHDRMDYEAVALLATQPVAGTNYCFLCRTSVIGSSENPTYQLVYIWQDLSDNVHILEVRDIDFGLTGETAQPETELLSDGEHRIILTGDTDVFIECPKTAKAGETVTVTVTDVCDGEVTVTLIGADNASWENGNYVFTMPDTDVELNGGISTAGYPGS